MARDVGRGLIVALPVAIAAGAVGRRRVGAAVVVVPLTLLAVVLVLVVGVVGVVVGLAPVQGGYGPSATARAEIPPAYLRLYERAGERFGVDPWVLAAIGWVETDHGRSGAPGVHTGVNAHGCCAGPMQFSVVGSPSTWESYGLDGDGDGHASPYAPADAIPAAARYLRDHGAPADYRAALFAYNHADWYVADVLAKADVYRGAAVAPGALPEVTATAAELLRNPRVQLTVLQRADLAGGLIDPRLTSALAAIAARHTVLITALRSDHSLYTVDGGVSNHSAGRAMDIAVVDGEVCRGMSTGACAELVRELAAVTGRLRATELIYCWDPDGPGDPRGFARADHCDHIHWGMDA
jgi:hypothetical protein